VPVERRQKANAGAAAPAAKQVLAQNWLSGEAPPCGWQRHGSIGGAKNASL